MDSSGFDGKCGRMILLYGICGRWLSELVTQKKDGRRM